MIALAAWPFAFAVLGALIYAFSANTKLAELGRIIFACGFLVLAFTLARATLEITR